MSGEATFFTALHSKQNNYIFSSSSFPRRKVLADPSTNHLSSKLRTHLALVQSHDPNHQKLTSESAIVIERESVAQIISQGCSDESQLDFEFNLLFRTQQTKGQDIQSLAMHH